MIHTQIGFDNSDWGLNIPETNINIPAHNMNWIFNEYYIMMFVVALSLGINVVILMKMCCCKGKRNKKTKKYAAISDQCDQESDSEAIKAPNV